MLWIYDSGASESEIRDGVSAAMAHAEKMGWDVAEILASIDDSDSEDWDVAVAHLQAMEHAAFTAAFNGWQRWPEAAVLARA